MPLQNEFESLERRSSVKPTSKPKLPKHIWATYNPDYPADVRWAFHRTKADHTYGLKPMRLLVRYAPEITTKRRKARTATR